MRKQYPPPRRRSSEPNARPGYLVSRCPYTLALDEKITAIPWWAL